jgi:hypothetical protein
MQGKIKLIQFLIFNFLLGNARQNQTTTLFFTFFFFKRKNQTTKLEGGGGGGGASKKRQNYQIYLVGFECVVKDIEA